MHNSYVIVISKIHNLTPFLILKIPLKEWKKCGRKMTNLKNVNSELRARDCELKMENTHRTHENIERLSCLLFSFEGFSLFLWFSVFALSHFNSRFHLHPKSQFFSLTLCTVYCALLSLVHSFLLHSVFGKCNPELAHRQPAMAIVYRTARAILFLKKILFILDFICFWRGERERENGRSTTTCSYTASHTIS